MTILSYYRIEADQAVTKEKPRHQNAGVLDPSNLARVAGTVAGT
jgi:hypothetical protein